MIWKGKYLTQTREPDQSECRCRGIGVTGCRRRNTIHIANLFFPRYADTPTLRYIWFLNSLTHRYADTPIREAGTIKIDEISGVKLFQTPKGVKASVDGVLLARYQRPAENWRVADLGCGNGLVGLLMARGQPRCRVVGIEIQDVLVKQAARSAKLNRMSGVSFLRADLRHPPWKDNLCIFDLVVANPPYRKIGTGRLSPDPVRAAARHELFGDVDNFAASAFALLRAGASSVWIYLAERREDIFNAVAAAGLEPVRFRYVISRKGESPSLVLMEAVKGKREDEIFEEEPLILYEKGKGREYTEEARAIIFG
jgi:tRNA1Val (adenine37-N6)-methyltransferase